MLDLIKQAGFGGWPVVLFGLISLVTAGLFTWRPDRKKLAYLRGMTTATIFAVLAGLVSGCAATLQHAAHWDGPEPWSHALMVGLAESLANPILGFALLALSWMLTAFGLRRFEAE